ncbi:hypothetical protein, variant 1 [Aphanomyces invadans]|uniref:Aminopeptidase P N-terminal domain-containing protein n=1 Tax=Aphanomyces invadans TaxID=157072 RepID=A0A024UPS6_9STRA|nr:hypothetical protein, variant 1 [Aphanomyces invadans]ETW08200.1 hypothetical protein, variant 1 [Aphanomyces invadans]|eukprot:XP_008862005.1 hypothetical protein, variant 1 [Aphanomyces invadans]
MHRLTGGSVRFLAHRALSPCSHSVSRALHHLVPHNPFELKENELVPGIQAAEFQQRREQAVDLLPPNSILVLNASEEKYSSHDIPYDFRQDSHFLYLTGLDEPDAVAVLKKNADSTSEYILFVRPRDAHSEQWDGPRTDVELATTKFLADAAFTVDEFEGKLLSMAAPDTQICLTAPVQGRYPQRFLQASRTIAQTHQFQMADALLDSLRVIKSPAEVAKMKEAADIGVDAFCSVMASCAPGQLELALAGHFEAKCRARGAPRNSFPCVVGAGANGSVIHYLSKRSMLKPHELVLMDSGCEITGNYVSDITRTWPIDGRFTTPQATLYSLILDVQLRCLERLKLAMERKSTLTLDELHHYSVGLLGQGMKDCGIIPATVSLNSTEFNHLFRSYNPTHLSHYLGMDVHDTPRFSRSSALRPGMVVTVEPGIYLPKHDTRVPAEFRGIGIRIEDDVLVRHLQLDANALRGTAHAVDRSLKRGSRF